MPFIYDETNIEWPDDDDQEPPLPQADQFVYLAPPDLFGAPEPVRFSAAEPPPAAEPAPSAPGAPPRSVEEVSRQHEKRQEGDRQRTFALAVPELRKAGVRRLYCRYDGGHDEGFSWLDHVEMTDGARLDAGVISGRLYDAGLLGKIYAAELMRPSVHFSDRELLTQFVDHWLANEWAAMLLGGNGYGTGEYSMYGAFTVDLDACTITDDRNAAPIVKNIRIAT